MKNRTCGECKWYNKSTEFKSKALNDIVHACDKHFICNSWNLNNGCVYFELDDKIFYKEANDKFRDAVDIKTEEEKYDIN